MAGKKTPEKPAEQEEVNLLRALEKSERRIIQLVGEKELAVDEHNTGIKEAKADRRSVLAAIQDYRQGVQSLPLE
jgi:hypothetical protein